MVVDGRTERWRKWIAVSERPRPWSCLLKVARRPVDGGTRAEAVRTFADRWVEVAEGWANREALEGGRKPDPEGRDRKDETAKLEQ